ncbi:hypothetical protein V2G26_013019 [Clonostachys chloroleuca]
MPSDDSQLQVVLKAKAKRENDPNITTQVILEMKSSLIFQISWQDLLQAGPTSLSSMGACFAASASRNAALILEPPPKGFTYLKYPSVKANLIECGNLGRFAFVEAEAGMGLIQQTGAVMNGKMNDVLKMINDPPTAKKLLKPQLNTIKAGANSCLDAAQKIDKKFEDWLLFACELHAACVAQDQTNQEALLSNEACIAAEQTRLDLAKSSVEDAKKTTELLGKQVSMAGDAFKTASDKFPTGWDIMGQQIVGDLAHCVTTALNAAIPALVDTLNPMKKLKAAGDVVGSFVHPDKSSSGGNNNADPDGPPPAPRPRPSPVPQNSNDPAYSEVIKLTTYLSALKAIVKNKDNDVDWDRAKGDGSQEGAKSSINFLQDMFSDHVTQFAAVATTTEPSQELATVLDTCTRISSEIESELQKSKSMSHPLPEKSSATVTKWQSEFDTQNTKAEKIASTGRSLAGSSAGVPVVANSEVEVAQVNARTTQAQAVLDSAKNRLETTQQMLATSQTNYVKSTELLLQQQNKVADLQGNLLKLTASNLGMKEIRAILISCIQLIINLKQNITDLLRFFNSLSVIIEVAVKTHVEPFLETVTSIVTNGQSDKELIKIADYSLVDLERTTVFSAVVTIRSYFGVFSDIANMWIKLSNDNIMPGLRICDQCASSLSDDPNAAQTLKKLVDGLNVWAAKASQNVATLAGDKQKEILDGMQDRIDNVQETTAQLEPPP